MRSPAELFMENWYQGCRWSGPEVQNFVSPCAEFERAIHESLLLPSAQESYDALKNLQRGESLAVANGRILYTLRAIDDFFEIIHPRTQSRSKILDSIPLEHWLRKLIYIRLENGAFSSTEKYQLIPKGPLLRAPREEFSSSGYSFPDQFAFLSVVLKELPIEERPIRISTIVLNRSLSQGAGLAPSSHGSEKVAFIPVGQLNEHLVVEESIQNGHAYVDFRLSDNIDAATVIDTVLDEIGYADIVMSAELMVDAAAADKLSPLMCTRPGRTRILVAGSGNTVETRENLPWNEARVLNGVGVELWRQRKVWQAGLDSERATNLGLTPGTNGRLMEHNHAGEEIVVADVEGLGRCIVLICQDIQSNPLASDLLRIYQPDWVFVPILDWGAGIKRWAHQRAYELSGVSHARFLIASSLSMVERLKKEEQPCGLAIGPKTTTEDDQGRVCEAAYAKASPHGYGMVEWRSGWGNSAITYKPSRTSGDDTGTAH